MGYNLKQSGSIDNNGHTLGFKIADGSTPYIMGGRLPAGDRYGLVSYPNPLKAPIKIRLFRNVGLLLVLHKNSAKMCQ